MSNESIFKILFAGNPHAHCTRGADGQYVTFREPVTDDDISRHLRGQLPSVLSIPILPDGNCHFGALDIDRHDPADVSVDHVALAQRITSLGLPLVVCKSKNPKGAHCFLFLKEKAGYSASTVQRLLKHYAKVLAIDGEFEIFPKQDHLEKGKDGEPGETGNGINLPFAGSERIAFGKDGDELDLTGFLALAQERSAYGQLLESRDLTAASADVQPGDAPKEGHPMHAQTARKLHADNIANLKAMTKPTDHQNDALNTACFFGARAFAAGILEGTEEQIQEEIRKVAVDTKHCPNIDSTIRSGWASGIGLPLKILEDEFPEAARCLKEFNEAFYVIENLGGQCAVCWEEIVQETGNLYLGHQSFENFQKRFMHLQIQTGETTSGRGEKKKAITEPVFKSKGDYWLHAAERRQFAQVVYAPGEVLAPNIRNLWRGFSVEAKKGNCDLYLAHVLENICKGNQDKFDWLIRWFAWKVRNPGLKSDTCPVLQGAEGSGKNVCVDAFAFLFGPHALQVTKKEHISGHFNAHLRACSVLIGNEAFYAGDRGQESTLKSLITDDSFMLEAKGVDPVPARNRLSIIIVSNENWIVPAGPTARRFSVFDVGNNHREDHSYFNAIQLELCGGRNNKKNGYSALLWYLLHEVKMGDFEPKNIIRTEALSDQQSLSLRGADALWHDVLYRGELPGALKGNLIQSERLLKWAQLQHNRKYEGISDRQLGQVLGENAVGVYQGMGFKHARPRPLVDNHQVRAWAIPSLRDARATWDAKRFAVEWPDVEPMQGVTAGRAEYDPDDWVIVPVGDEPKTVRHEASGIPGEETPF